MRVVVTGASGSVGSGVCGLLPSRGHLAIAVVRSASTAGLVARLGAAPVLASLEPASLAEAFQGADAVVHLAQIGKQTSSSSFASVNLGGTRAVIAAARQARVRRIVYFSGLGVAHYGITPHCTNAYFLSKLACETELFSCGLETIVLRPSYILAAGGEFLTRLVDQVRSGEAECIGDGRYRLQPIALSDAISAVLAALERPAGQVPFVYDLVGPEPLSYLEWLGRLAAAAGVPGTPSLRQIPLEFALRRAEGQGRLEDLDCLLCDETADPAPLEVLLGRSLMPLDEALRAALQELS